MNQKQKSSFSFGKLVTILMFFISIYAFNLIGNYTTAKNQACIARQECMSSKQLLSKFN